MKLCIADPPYPPMYSERRDLAGGGLRTVSRSRAVRWYGDMHPEAAIWDNPSTHREMMLDLIDDFDGWAIATTPDGLGSYYPLPVSAHVMAWGRPNGAPGAGRLIHRWEPVIVSIPEQRRARGADRVSDLLVAASPRSGFPGAKPAAWTRWVLEALGYDPGQDELIDLFPGSGAVAAAADGMLAMPPADAEVPA